MLSKILSTEGKILIRNARILDVAAGELSDPANILTENGKILEVGTSRTNGCAVIDLEGLTLSPGLIDCHVHILSPFQTEQKKFPGLWTLNQMDRNCIATLAAGITCVCDMLAPIKVLNRVRGRIATGSLPGPDIVYSGGIFSCHGGYPEPVVPVPGPIAAAVGQAKYQPATPAQAARLVQYIHKLGARVVKIGYTRLSRKLVDGKSLPAIKDDVLRALCDAGHRLGMKVRVHHNWSEDMLHLLEFDIDALEHGVYDRNLLDEEVRAVKDKGITLCPTLTINDSQARFEEKLGFLTSNRAKEYFHPEALKHLLWVCKTWTSFSGESYDGSFGYTRANRCCYDTQERNTRNLFAAGVPICAGTDSGAAVGFFGELADELRRLNVIGMSERQAVRSATIDAADLIGRPDLGVIKPGKTAFFCAVEGNPLRDLKAYKRVRYVGKGNIWYKTIHPELPDFWQGHKTIYSMYSQRGY